MSDNFEERVVKMELDNSQFKKAADETNETIDELQENLQFKDAEEGMQKIQDSADEIDFSKFKGGLDSLAQKFSYLGNIGSMVLYNLKKEIADALTSQIKSDTIGQISQGWNKYAEKTTAVQTIMAATGKDIDYVNERMTKLNWYTDETSYSFTDMASNIGKFTSAGVDLDTATNSMIGIANWAAQSGQNASTASRAMYNFAQAIGAGSMKLQDWKSIENANMATEEFKEECIKAGIACGTLVEKQGKVYVANSKTQVSASNLSQTLSKGWMTTSVMNKVLGEYADYTNQVYEVYQEGGKTTSEIIEEMDDATDGVKSLGQRAFASAQEAKTFADALSSVKDAVSTGWMNIWEKVFGNYTEAKELWTDFANFLYDVFAAPLEPIVELLEEWHGSEEDTADSIYDMDTGYGALMRSLNNIMAIIERIGQLISNALGNIFPETTAQQLTDITKKFEALTETLKELLGVEDQISTATGGTIHHDAVTEKQEGLRTEGMTDKEYRSMFEKGGAALQLDEYKNASKKVQQTIAWQGKGRGRDWSEDPTAYSHYDEFTDEEKQQWLDYWDAFSGKDVVITEAYDEVVEVVEQGEKAQSVADKLSTILEGLASVINTVLRIITDVKDAALELWDACQPLVSVILDIFTDLGSLLKVEDEQTEETDIFRSVLMGIVDILEPIINLVAQLLQVGRTFIHEVIQKLDENGVLGKIKEWFSGLNDSIGDGSGSVASWLSGFLGDIPGALSNLLAGVPDAIANFFANLFGIATDTVTTQEEKAESSSSEGGAVEKKAESWAVGVLKSIWEGIKSAIASIPGMLSEMASQLPSDFEGIFGGISDAIKNLFDSDLFQQGPGSVDILSTILGIIKKIIGFVGDIVKVCLNNFPQLLNGIWTFIKSKALLNLEKGITSFINNFGGVFRKIGNFFDSGSSLMKAATKKLKGNKFERFGKTFLKIAASIILIAMAIRIIVDAILPLTKLSLEEIGKFTESLAVITAAIVVLIYAMSKAVSGKGKKMPKLSSMLGIVAIAYAMKIIVQAIMPLADYDWQSLGKIGSGLALLSAAIVAFMLASSKMKGVKLSAALILLSAALSIRIIADSVMPLTNYSWESLGKMGAGLTVLAGAIVAFMLFASKTSGTGLGGVLVLLSAALSIRILVNSLMPLADMSWDQLSKMGASLGAFILSIVAVMLIASHVNAAQTASLAGLFGTFNFVIAALADAIVKVKDVDFSTILSFSAGLAVVILTIAVVMKICGGISNKQLLSSMAVFAGFSVIIAAFGSAAKKVKGMSWKTLLAFSAGLSLIVVALSAALLIASKIDFVAGLKGIALLAVAIAAIGAVFALIIDLVGSSLNRTITQLASTLQIASSAIGDFLEKMSEVGEVDGIADTFDALFKLVCSSPSQDTINAFRTAMASLVLSAYHIKSFYSVLGEVGSDSITTGGNVITQLASLGNDMSGLIAICNAGSLKNLGTQLTDLGAGLKLYAASLVDIGPIDDAGNLVNVEGAITLLDSIVSALTKDENLDDIGDITSKLPSESNLDTFAVELVALSTALVQFSTDAQRLKPVFVARAEDALNFFNTLDTNLTARKAFLTEWGANTNPLGEFSTNIVDLGAALCHFYDSVKDLDSAKVTTATDALTILQKLNTEIPNGDSTVFRFLFGDKDLGSWGTKLATLGTGLATFGTNVADVDDAKVTAAASALKILGELQTNIPNLGGVFSWFTGDQDIAAWGSKLGDLGDGLVDLSTHSQGIDADVIETKVKPAISQLTSLMRAIPRSGNDGWTLGDIAQDLLDKNYGLGDALVNFTTTCGGINLQQGQNGVTLMGDLLALVRDYKDLTNDDFEHVADIANALGTQDWSGFGTAGQKMLEAMSNGIYDNWATFTGALNMLCEYILADEDLYDRFVAAGEYLGSGFMSGLMGDSSGLGKILSLVSGSGEYQETSGYGPVSPVVSSYTGGLNTDAIATAVSSKLADTWGLDLKANNNNASNTAGSGVDRTDEILTAIGLVNESVNGLGTQMSGMKIYLNTGVLVGQLAPGIDNWIGARISMKRRGG